MMYFGDTIIADLTPYYMEADLLIKDTMLIDTIRFAGEGGSTGSYVDTTYQTMLILSNIKHDVEYFQLNVFVDEHEITLKANTKAGESIVTVKDEKGIKNIVLPKSAQLSIALDGQVLATLNGQYDSDLIIYVEDVKEGILCLLHAYHFLYVVYNQYINALVKVHEVVECVVAYRISKLNLEKMGT